MNTPATPKKNLSAILLAAIAAAGLSNPAAYAVDGIWDLNSDGNWGDTNSWLDGDIADGVGAVADFSQFNITANRVVTINTASRTVGTLLFGDTTASPTAFHNYTIAASGGGTLIFDNNGLGAALVQGLSSGANTISAPVVLADNLGVSNNSAVSLTLSGGITAGSAGIKTITNAGTGAGGTTLSGVVANGSGTVALVQNSSSSALTLSGASTFTGGVTVKSGNVIVGNNAALGTGTVLLGDTTGSAEATLTIGSFTVANNVTVQAGGTGKRTIAANGSAAARPTGNFTLNNHLTLAVASGGQNGRSTGAYLATTGTISGTGDLNLDVGGSLSTSNGTNSPQMDSLSVGGSITTSGAINNVGAGSGRAIVAGVISNASSVNQNSATSILTLSGANTYSGPTHVNAGILRVATASTALSPNSAVTVASGATLQLGGNQSSTQLLTLSGHGNASSSGALEATNGVSYAAPILLAADATVASTLANTTLTLSGGVTGPGRTLTVGGAAGTTISGVIDTGSGGLAKDGAGVLTLSGSNTYTGATTINHGTVALSHAGALGVGGAIAFNGGTLRHSATNTVDYASRITGGSGPISIDTNSQNVTYAGNIDATNTGGLTKLGAGRLTLSGANAFSGPVAVGAGVLAVSGASALPSGGAALVFLDSSGALNSGGAYTGVQGWLDSGNIASGSTGAIALTGSSAESINFAGYGNLSLGASANSVYTGTLSPAGATYRLGGGGATLTLTNANILTGANGLVVSGAVALGAANDLSGPTTVNSGTLTLNAGGTLASSAVTVGAGSTLAVTSATSGSPITRAASLELERGTFTLAGNATANSTDAITGSITIGSGGHSTATLTANAARNTLLTAGGFGREAGSTALVRGSNLGVNSLAAPAAGASNISFSSAPALVGGAGSNTTDRGILVGVVGDTSVSGTGYGATGGLLTYDATNGLRLLSGSEYKSGITSGQTQLDNVQLSKSTAGALTTTVNDDTTINSLSLKTSGVAGAAVAVDGTGKLTLNSGVIYANSATTTTASSIANAIDFNGREGFVLVGGTADLGLSGALGGTGGNGLTVHATGRTVTLSGAAANTYTGTTTLNGGTLALGKTAGVNAIGGDLLVNSGGTASMSASNQIADSASVTVNGGTFSYRTETINNLALSNGASAAAQNANSIALTVGGALTISGDATLSTTASNAGTVNVGGATSLSNGGALVLGRSQNVSGAHDSVATLNGPLTITHKATGAYTPITIGHGSGTGQAGAKLVLGGDVTFVGNATNTNTVLIDAIRGTGAQGVVALTTAAGDRTFNIGNGAASVDLRITAALQNGDSVTSGLVKSGLGTLQLSGASTYTGSTTINSGTLLLGASDRIANSSNLVLGGGTFATGGFSDTLGTLSLGASSFIDFGAGSSALLFADSSALSWTGSVSLSLLNFTEGLDSIRFGTTNGGLTGLQLGQITINGVAAAIDANGFLFASAIPEPSAFAGLAGAAGLLTAVTRRRRRSV